MDCDKLAVQDYGKIARKRLFFILFFGSGMACFLELDMLSLRELPCTYQNTILVLLTCWMLKTYWK